MLPDDVVLKNSYYWASHFYQKGVDFDELVNIGYMTGKVLSDARLLKDHIRYTLLHHVQEEQKFRGMSRGEDIEVEDDISCEKDFKHLYLSIHKAKLSEKEMSVLVLYFFKDYTQPQIAEQLHITQQSVSCYIKRALKKIKRILMQLKSGEEQ